MVLEGMVPEAFAGKHRRGRQRRQAAKRASAEASRKEQEAFDPAAAARPLAEDLGGQGSAAEAGWTEAMLAVRTAISEGSQLQIEVAVERWRSDLVQQTALAVERQVTLQKLEGMLSFGMEHSGRIQGCRQDLAAAARVCEQLDAAFGM